MSTVQLWWKSCGPPSDPNTYTLSVDEPCFQAYHRVLTLCGCDTRSDLSVRRVNGVTHPSPGGQLVLSWPSFRILTGPTMLRD